MCSIVGRTSSTNFFSQNEESNAIVIFAQHHRRLMILGIRGPILAKEAVKPTTRLIGCQWQSLRGYSEKTDGVSKKKKSQPMGDITQVPIKNISVIADYYIPPPLLRNPVTSWHKLILRRLGSFAMNTYSVVKFRNETGLKLKFNDWKEAAMEKFVRTNKIFASSCNLPLSKRENYLKLQLDGNSGSTVIQHLINRSKTFPVSGKLSWELLSIESNPKIVNFTTLPDSSNITAYVQFTMKVKTKQKVTFEDKSGSNGGVQNTERIVTDNLVFSLDPYSEDMALVGTLFDSNHTRGVQPEVSFRDAKIMQEFQQQASDIFRSKPN